MNAPSSPGCQRDVPLAIIGISCIFPEAEGLQAYWHNIRNGVDAITDIPDTHWSPRDFFDADPKAPDMTYASRGGFLPTVDFNPLDFGIAPNALEATDTAQLLGLYTASQALIDAGYGPDREFDKDRVCVVLGVTGTLELTLSLGARLGHPFWRRALAESGVPGEVAEQVVRRIADSYVEWQEASFPGLLGNVVAGRIANRLDLGGTNCVVDAACASSLSALHLASLELANGRCDMAITGGVDTLNDIFMYMCFSKTPALSPTGNARPFDHEGDGTILGEGIGMLVLKRLDDAVLDGDRIYAEIIGLGTSSDGKGNAIYAPSQSGQAKALRRAYERAAVTPDTVQLVEAHGTGTVVGDAVESEALTAVYRESRAEGTWCALGSVKSQIGHTKAAAGAASLIKVAMALHHRVLPPTLKVDKPLAQLAPEASPFYVNTDKRPWLTPVGHPRRAAVSSFGFGGSNFHCLLQEHVRDEGSEGLQADWDGDVQVLAFAAPTRHRLKEWLARLAQSKGWNAVRELGQASREAFRPDDTERLLLVVEKARTDVAAVATRAESLLDTHTESTWSTPDGVYYGRGVAAGNLAFLFPGQGSQYVGMLRDLACQFPSMAASLELAEAEDPEDRLSNLIYPHPAFDDETRQMQEDLLRDTRNAQPAIGAVSLGTEAVLRLFGVEPVAVAGHSFGELTALCAASRLSKKNFHELAQLRGRLMGEQDGGRGAMLAVRAGLTEVEKIITEESLDLIVANRNAPTQVVLSGAVSEIERAATALGLRQIDARRLPVSAAFHSRLVAEAEEPFADALGKIRLGEGTVQVYANSTAAPYPGDETEAKALLAGQLARPVLFEDLIRQMVRDGIQTFIETGPHARLTGLVASILDGEPHYAIALDAAHGSRSGIPDLARVLALIGSLGHTVDLRPWDAAFRPTPTPASGRTGLTHPVGGANIRTRKRGPMQDDNIEAAPPAMNHRRPGETVAAPAPVAPTAPSAAVALTVTGAANAPAAASVAEALRVTQENMVALQRLQQQTAQLHQQFLEGQNASQQHFHTLLLQQQHFVELSLGLPPAPVSDVVPAAPIALPIAPPTQPPLPAASAIESPASIGSEVRVAPPAAPEPTPAPTADSTVDVAQILLDIVAEKTGYPADVLELSMELDADLGIDSIKRVEILSALEEALPNAPEVRADQLGTLLTLQSLLDLMPAEAGAPAPAAVVAVKPRPEKAPEISPQTTAEASATTSAATLAVGALQRSVLRSLELNDTAEEDVVRPAAGALIWITDGDAALTAAIQALLRRDGYEPRAVSAGSLNGAADEPVAGLVLLPPHQGTSDADLLDMLQVVQAAACGLRAAGRSGGAFLVSASRLDGAFGTTAGEIVDPLSGGLAGLTKSVAQEWPEVRCRALDLASDLDILDAAGAIVAEMFSAGPLEVGLSAAGRTRLQLVDRELVAANGSLSLSEGEVVVLSGGARGITAEVALALARSCRPTLVLLGRSPEPQVEPEWLAGLETEAEIKRGILARGEATSPRDAGESHKRIRAEREIRDNLSRMREAGATVRYLQVDVREAAAVSGALSAVAEDYGPVRVLVHGAGVLADQHILDKTADSFKKVYEPKVAGLRNLLGAVDRDALRALVIFSSSTARYGRAGQVDYAIANEVLNKVAQQEARRLPDCRVLSLNWGPWEGGMVDESLQVVFANEGVPLIPLAQGADHLLHELASDETAVERLIMGPCSSELAKPEPTEPIASSALPLVAEEEIGVASCSFLRSHVLDSKAVVPMAILPEWLAHGALHGNPGLKFHGCDHLSVLKGLVLETDASVRLKIHAGDALKDDEGYRVPVELRAEHKDGREFLFARAEILLTESLPTDEPRLDTPAGPPYEKTAAETYRDHLFHGPDLQGIVRVHICSPEGVVADAEAAPSPKEWMKRPFRRHWLTDPLALDVGIQLLTFWTGVHSTGPSLPCAAASYRQYRAFPKEGTRVVARVTKSTKTRVFADIEFIDTDGQLVARFEGCENTIDEGLWSTFRSNRLPVEVGS